MHHSLRKITHALLLLAALLALALVAPRVWHRLSESEPYRVDLSVSSALSADISDHDWLTLRGRVATEAAVVSESDTIDPAHPGTWTFIPLVPTTWSRGDPVSAFVITGPVAREQAEREIREAGAIRRFRESIKQTYDVPVVRTGVRLDPATAPFLRGKFTLAANAVLVLEDAKPKPVPGQLFIAIACAFMIAYTTIRLANDDPPPDLEDDRDAGA